MQSVESGQQQAAGAQRPPRLVEELPVPQTGLPPLTDREFRAFQHFIYAQVGIRLSDAKRALLMGRLGRRLRELQLSSFGSYLERAQEDAVEQVQLFDLISTNETHFFREPKHFDFLEHELLPHWRAQGATPGGSRRVRVWSAGCSTGEEPYSLGMLLRHALPAEEGWDVDILATDLSSRVLARARAALWPVEKSRDIPQHLLKAFMLKGTASQEGLMKAGPLLRSLVRFERLNLNEQPLRVRGPFDLVFCRNVLIYFDAASKARVIEQLLDRLAPGGHFFLGHAESLNGVTQRVRPVRPTVYTAVPAPQR
ncbi:protein-glutamate O-methyltransferase CheR [Aggregicoccus sp. 17bor-14]|uniref:CheR family methyltransferase n=1 Tax=Myxococcaceae TaxID=31 RepID=UPI00129CA9A6|nr:MULTISPECIES: protein-glutamate O-methyltransferase CheR [Myxococcaceae]MBF5044350.1 protein-glutamate O-methyltransferase CheR [Simulacricoccus sp. 17bor-14]MRI90097.1 protein-glutamate O-methyltransferase CheR [Aggregicoccus sp. 17bor-14]